MPGLLPGVWGQVSSGRQSARNILEKQVVRSLHVCVNSAGNCVFLQFHIVHTINLCVLLYA